MNRIRLAIVIVNFRTPDLSLRAMDSVIPQLDAQRDVVLLVENGSGDESASALEAGIRARGSSVPIRLLEAPENRGYSAGVNLGLCGVEAEYYLVLNSDIIVREGGVRELLDVAEGDDQPALVSPRLESVDGEAQISTFSYPSLLGELVEAAGSGPITRMVARYADDPEKREEWVSFAAVLIPRSTIGRIGLMDDAFFMFFEDVDYCRRVRVAGGETVRCEKARVVHLRGASSPVKSLRERREQLPAYFYESRSRYFTKHHGRVALWLANALWTLGRLVDAVRELGGRHRHNPRNAGRDIWRGAFRRLDVSRA